MAVSEDGAVQGVPGAAEGAEAGDGEGGVCFCDGGVVDIYTLYFALASTIVTALQRCVRICLRKSCLCLSTRLCRRRSCAA